MAQVEGITTIMDTTGEITHINIDVLKHKEALPTLKHLGLLEKTQFEIDCENGTSIEESRKGYMQKPTACCQNNQIKF